MIFHLEPEPKPKPTNRAPAVTIDQPARLIDGNGQTWTYDTFSTGCIDKMVDPLGRTTIYQLDSKTNVVVKMTGPNGSSAAYFYDSHGNLLSQTESFNGAKNSFTYDLVVFFMRLKTSLPNSMREMCLDSFV